MRFTPENQASGSLPYAWFSGNFSAFRRRAKLFVDMLIRNGLTERESPLAKAITRALNEAKKQ